MNILKNKNHYDIVVIGAGLAGIKAALTAARSGCSVLICTKSGLCSGSSFYTLMDTLHCQGNIDEKDKEVFLQDIMDCSYGMNDTVMNRYYIDHIDERIREFPDMGIAYERLPEPKLACFAGHPHSLYSWTDWPRIRSNVRTIFGEYPAITVREHTEAVCLVTDPSAVDEIPGTTAPIQGILLSDQIKGQLEYVSCAAVIFATGGFGGLFQHNLNSFDVTGDGHALALMAGARLINLEFNQFIPGFLEPIEKIVFREGSLDYCQGLFDEKGVNILKEYLPDPADYDRCLQERAFHGPFTSTESSRYFDIVMMKNIIANPAANGVRISYDPGIYHDQRSYMVHYLDWLEEKYQINLCRDKVTIAPFFHAANGGIYIGHNCDTDVPGLYACGEAAGGIHGADRLGGNATGSCLVFGYLAAQSACEYAKKCRPPVHSPTEMDLLNRLRQCYDSHAASSLSPQEVISAVRKLMWTYANVVRTEEGLSLALAEIGRLNDKYNAFLAYQQCGVANDVFEAARYLLLAKAILAAMQNRKESRGAHYREDYPEIDPMYDKRYGVQLDAGRVAVVEMLAK